MSLLIAALLGAAIQNGSAANLWTWALYEDDGPLVLANEIPDTPQLRSTLECEPGSGVARVSIFGSPMGAGFIRVTAGAATATTETDGARRDKTQVTLRTDHPVFTQFVASGALSLVMADQSRAITVERSHRAKLRRFAGLCGG